MTFYMLKHPALRSFKRSSHFFLKNFFLRDFSVSSLDCEKLPFQSFYDFENGQFSHISPDFLNWFIGFFEGDGCLTITSRGDLCFVITQHNNDIQILNKIQKTLGFGSVIKQGLDTSRYSIQNLSDLYKIMLIFNGNLRLPSRQKQFLKFLDAFNAKLQKNKSGPKFKHLSFLVPKTTQQVITSKDAWMSGFVDAEGCFTVSFLRESATFQIRFMVTQKGTVNLPLLSTLILVFGVGSIEPHTKSHVYSFVISGSQNCLKVYSYFHKYPLQTKKAKSFEI